MEDGLPTMAPTTTRRRGRLVAGFAVAAILFLGACSGDDDDSEGAGSSDGSGQATETTTAEEQAGAAGDAGADADAPAGDDQAFCDWFTSVGPNSTEWDMAEAATMTPPAAIAEQFQAIVDGTATLTQESEVTRWATENCF